MKYQFPRSLAIEEELKTELGSENALKFYCEHEKEWLEQKISRVAPGLHLIKIPTIIYELEMLNYFWELRQGHGWDNVFRGTGISEYCTVESNIRCVVNSHRNWLIKLHYEINNRLISIFKSLNANENNVQALFNKTTEKLFTSLCEFSKKIQDSQLGCIFNESFIEKLKHFESLEADADIRGDFVLSRGTNGFEGCLDKLVFSSCEYQHLSYGNSLFAGYVNDSGACVYDFVQHSKLGYTVMIKKSDYFNTNAQIRKLFWISPMGTIESFVAYGERFHSTTNPWKTVNTDDNIAAEKTFQDYLKLNAVVVSNK
jgi:hypothetical protein